MMNNRFFAASALLAATAFCCFSPQAMAEQVASKDPKLVKAGTYKVDPYHTQVGFTISHFGFSDFSGFLSGASGTLTLDGAKPNISKLNVTIPVESVLTTVPSLDTELKGDKWFDVARFPNATFTSTKVSKTGEASATVVGDLTIHGVTKSVSLKVKLIGSGVNPLDKSFTVGFEAAGEINRGDFGIKQYLPLLSDEVALKIAGAFVLQQ